MSKSSFAADRRRLTVHPTWRIFAAMALAQLPGAVIGLWLTPTGDRFMDLWYGGAFAMPVGFVFGLLWQSRSAPDVLSKHRLYVLALGLFSVACPVFGALTYGTWLKVAAAG